MKRTDLTDVTFIIPIRLDSIVRIENIMMVIMNIENHFKTAIHILNADKHDNRILPNVLPKNVKYTFIQDCDPIFHRTKYINLMTNAVNTPFISVWDADVIVPKRQLLESVEQLRTGSYQMAFPYEGHLLNTGNVIREYYIQKRYIRTLIKNANMMEIMYGDNCVGGCFIVNLDAYRAVGGENEEFYGWGYEDYERVTRMDRKGCKIYRSKGNAYHLTHPRDINGNHSNIFQRERSKYIADCYTNMVDDNKLSTL